MLAYVGKCKARRNDGFMEHTLLDMYYEAHNTFRSIIIDDSSRDEI